MSESQTPVSDIVTAIFGERALVAENFVRMLEQHGVERGLIGPRELPKLWERHLLNSAVIGECIPHGATVIDVGSGAGFPGIPLAIARPDLQVVLLEPMVRRIDWLTEVLESLPLPQVTLVRGRAEEDAVRRQLADSADVVTARAVAPLARLTDWCLPLARIGGKLLAIKGASASEEVDRDLAAIGRAGGATPELVHCGGNLLATPTTVVAIPRVGVHQVKHRRKR